MGRYYIWAPFLANWICVADPAQPYYGHCDAVNDLYEASLFDKRGADRYMTSVVRADHAAKRKVVSA